MKTRIISAVVGIVLLIGLLICPYLWVFALGAAVLAAMATYELLSATGKVKARFPLWTSMAFAALETFAFYLIYQYGRLEALLLVLLVLYGVLMVGAALRCHETISASDLCGGAFLTAYVTLGFGSLTFLRECDLYYVLLVLVVAWMSDTGAYFVGTFLGKHKMTPVISPKKSWEGFFGGWAVAILSALLLTVIFRAFGLEIALWKPLVFAFVAAPLSVCGDLFASVIKRQCGIKDYGNIMPGHGGVMDRFDSVLIIAPVMLILMGI